ncbi:MAG: MmcQ/YjbR family DNA-binding protein [Flavobacteriales bacterium]|nr:MmcQ/YjbR family DNA-binding protein [Flavobacteriales bacterium]
MHLDEFRKFCLNLKCTSESFPFDDKILVFRVLNKSFALTNIEEFNLKVNLKCDPEYAIELREKYEEVIPGYHMSKKHWNTVDFTGKLNNELLLSLTQHSYDMVVKGMTKKEREIIASA